MIENEILSTEKQIAEVERDIKKVEEDISEVTEEIKQSSEGKNLERLYKKEERLWEKEKQLREKEKQLRDNNKQIQSKMELLQPPPPPPCPLPRNLGERYVERKFAKCEEVITEMEKYNCAFLGPKGTGKTTTLIQAYHTAIQLGLKAYYFDCSDNDRKFKGVSGIDCYFFIDNAQNLRKFCPNMSLLCSI